MFILFVGSSDVEQIGLDCRLKVCSGISVLRKAAGKMVGGKATPST